MSKWIQLNIFTGEPIPPRDEGTEKQQRIAKITRHALEVQFSIARGDSFSTTFKRIGELCETLTGIHYPFDVAKQQQRKQHHCQQQTQKAIDAEMKKPN